MLASGVRAVVRRLGRLLSARLGAAQAVELAGGRFADALRRACRAGGVIVVVVAG